MGHIIDNAALRGVSLGFLSVRFKTVTRSVAFLENHTCWHRGTPRCPKILEIAAIVENYTCCLPELFLQHRQSCSLRVILMQLSSMLGQIFLFFNVTPCRQKAALLTSPEILKIHICFTATEWVPLGTHSVGVKQMWIFKISGEVSNAAFCRHGVTLKNKKIWPSIDDNCINMTRKEQLFRSLFFSWSRR